MHHASVPLVGAFYRKATDAYARPGHSFPCLLSLAHIDLDPSQFQDGRLPPKVETYLARVGGRLLDIHTVSSPCDPATITAQHGFIQSIATISPRIGSMTVAAPDGDSRIDLSQRTISTILESCVPGVLTQLSIQVIGETPLQNPPLAPPEPLETTVEVLGLPITVLRLDNYFPKWTSKMYHGLTELRLVGYRGSVSESALMAILRLSPKLRALEIRIGITDTTRIHDPITPVLLADLEVFKPDNYISGYRVRLMRMVQPGPKPLTLFMEDSLLKAIETPRLKSVLNYHLSYPDHGAIKRFFSHSNVTHLVVYGLGNYNELANLLALTPMTRVLALDKPLLTAAERVESDLPPASTLDALYVAQPGRSAMMWPALEQLIRRHGIRKLTLWSKSGMGTIPDRLFTVCPRVTVISPEESNPIQEWMSLRDTLH